MAQIRIKQVAQLEQSLNALTGVTTVVESYTTTAVTGNTGIKNTFEAREVKGVKVHVNGLQIEDFSWQGVTTSHLPAQSILVFDSAAAGFELQATDIIKLTYEYLANGSSTYTGSGSGSTGPAGPQGVQGPALKYATTFNGPHSNMDSRNPSEDLGSLTVEAGLSYIGGEYITISPVVSPESTQIAQVTSYSGTTLMFNHIYAPANYSGSEDWNINLTGLAGTNGTSVKYNTVFDAPHGTDESRSPNESLGSLTVEAGLSYIGGEYITISPVVSPANIQTARVTTYDASTGVITFEHISHTGTQSYSGSEDWNLNLSGTPASDVEECVDFYKQTTSTSTSCDPNVVQPVLGAAGPGGLNLSFVHSVVSRIGAGSKDGDYVAPFDTLNLTKSYGCTFEHFNSTDTIGSANWFGYSNGLYTDGNIAQTYDMLEVGDKVYRDSAGNNYFPEGAGFIMQSSPAGIPIRSTLHWVSIGANGVVLSITKMEDITPSSGATVNTLSGNLSSITEEGSNLRFTMSNGDSFLIATI